MTTACAEQGAGAGGLNEQQVENIIKQKVPEAVHVRPHSDMRELLEEAGAGLADELAAEHFAAHERAVLYQSGRMRVLQSREGSGTDATYTRCARHIDVHIDLACISEPVARRW